MKKNYVILFVFIIIVILHEALCQFVPIYFNGVERHVLKVNAVEYKFFNEVNTYTDGGVDKVTNTIQPHISYFE